LVIHRSPLVLLLTVVVACCALAQTPNAPPLAPFDAPGTEAMGPTDQFAPDCATCGDDIGSGEWNQSAGFGTPWFIDQWKNIRSSKTHGRAMGFGEPLRGTSWLNRPYWVSLDVGALVMANSPAANVRENNDLFAAIGVGWDWDHYWGTQVRVGWATPSLENTALAANAGPNDTLTIADASLLYYPWGDSRVRPYWRVGLGITDIEYPLADGMHRNDNLLTTPLGFGVKYQARRWLIWRAEVIDNLAWGENGTSTLNNFTFTLGAEWRFGGRPTGSYAWHQRGHHW
jgi:hypothetical protein